MLVPELPVNSFDSMCTEWHCKLAIGGAPAVSGIDQPHLQLNASLRRDYLYTVMDLTEFPEII